MPIEIQVPCGDAAGSVDDLIEFRGTASHDIEQVRLVELQGVGEIPLSAARVRDGAWYSVVAFDTPGEHLVVIQSVPHTERVAEMVEVRVDLEERSSLDAPLTVQQPLSGSTLDLEPTVVWGGTAEATVARIRLRYSVDGTVLSLGSAEVTDGSWTLPIPFDVGGKLKVVVDGHSHSGTLLGSVSVSLVLHSSQPGGIEGRVVGDENTRRVFRDRVAAVAAQIGVQALFLMAVMSFETGGKFHPATRNPVSSATGLIQFMRATARALGTTLEALAQMTAVEQLDFVLRYFQPYTGRLQTLEDTYMAVLYPKAIGRGPDFVLFRRGSREYQQNRGLDLDQNGEITVREAATLVRRRILS